MRALCFLWLMISLWYLQLRWHRARVSRRESNSSLVSSGVHSSSGVSSSVWSACSIIHGQGDSAEEGSDRQLTQIGAGHPTHFSLTRRRKPQNAKKSQAFICKRTMQRLDGTWLKVQSMSDIFQTIRLWWNIAQVHHWHETSTAAEACRWLNTLSGSHIGFLQLPCNSWFISSKMLICSVLCTFYV